MSAKEKQGFSLYFLIAFGLAWLCHVQINIIIFLYTFGK